MKDLLFFSSHKLKSTRQRREAMRTDLVYICECLSLPGN